MSFTHFSPLQNSEKKTNYLEIYYTWIIFQNSFEFFLKLYIVQSVTSILQYFRFFLNTCIIEKITFFYSLNTPKKCKINIPFIWDRNSNQEIDSSVLKKRKYWWIDFTDYTSALNFCFQKRLLSYRNTTFCLPITCRKNHGDSNFLREKWIIDKCCFFMKNTYCCL